MSFLPFRVSLLNRAFFARCSSGHISRAQAGRLYDPSQFFVRRP